MVGVFIQPIGFNASFVLDCKDLNDWMKNGLWKTWEVDEEWAKKAYEQVMSMYGPKSKPPANKEQPVKEK